MHRERNERNFPAALFIMREREREREGGWRQKDTSQAWIGSGQGKDYPPLTPLGAELTEWSDKVRSQGEF